jgi:hypothetical protein
VGDQKQLSRDCLRERLCVALSEDWKGPLVLLRSRGLPQNLCGIPLIPSFGSLAFSPPFPRDVLECPGRHRGKGVRTFLPALDTWIDAFRKQAADFVTSLAGSLQRDVGPTSQPEQFFVALIPVLLSPEATTSRRDNQVEAVFMKKLLRFLRRLCGPYGCFRQHGASP